VITISALIFFAILIYWAVKSYTPPQKKWDRYYEQKAKYPNDIFKWYE